MVRNNISLSERSVIEDFRREFCPQLMDRLYPLVRWITDCEENIVLLINILDRSSPSDIEEQKLTYGGLQRQARFFQKDQNNASWKKDIDWKKLSLEEIPLTKAKVTGDLFKQFRGGGLGMEDIEVGNLSDYFEDAKENGKLVNEQKLEYAVLNRYFNISKDHFLSLPLIQFGKFDGVVHIIFNESDIAEFEDPIMWRHLIRQFSMEYEGLLMAFDLVGTNMEKETILREDLKYLTSEDYETASTTNHIFRQLKYRRYYLESYNYLLKRLDQIDEVPTHLKGEHRKRAIISILIDSYAHNISAHSLTVLKWWFQQRAKHISIEKTVKKIEEKFPFDNWGNPIADFLLREFPDAFNKEDIAKGLQSVLARWYGQLEDRKKEAQVYRAVRDQIFPLAKQLAPLFKFLLEKGAFWSGITRDRQFGGEIRNLYDVLWDDFIENPLYLGTIAYSEGITKLNIHIRCYSGIPFERSGDKEPFERTYRIKKVKGELLSGHFATIDVGGVKDNAIKHDYVEHGPIYEAIKRELETYQVFFPGGVVGKHSFFTLIENEIRNVKHYDEVDLKNMRSTGLDLFLAIRPATFSKQQLNYDEKPLYKFGVWIGTHSNLYDHDQHFIEKRFSRLMGDIITEKTHQAKLGGTYQDKICSAMLLNGTFNSVEERKKKRAKKYYPWIRAAYSIGLDKTNPELEHDFEVKKKNREAAFESLSDQSKHPSKGLFKKYFHLWQGAFIYHMTEAEAIEIENVNRFKIVNIVEETGSEQELEKPISGEELEPKQQVRAAGAIRVVTGLSEKTSWKTAYRVWLGKWLKSSNGRISFMQRATEIGHLVYDSGEIRYFPQEDYLDLPEELQEKYADYDVFELCFAHGSNVTVREQVLRIRSHGVLVEKYFDNLTSIDEFHEASITEEHVYELLEVIETRICIFDKRVAERVNADKSNFLKDQLKCHISDEDPNEWEKVKKEGLEKYHFIVLHLSFIEKLKNKEGKKYGEDGMVDFVREQIGDLLGDNCIFVITTGRGREEWWRSLQGSKYAINTTFRPVEMLIEAVESATMKKDDIELKHNLTKVLLGS